VLRVETIYLLVRNIVFIILLAVFVEMLLPAKETRRFLEVVVGLFILITILNPIVSLIRQEPPLDLKLEEGKKEELQGILDQGRELQEVQEVQARANYGKRLEEQIAAVACIVPGVDKAEASVRFAEGASLESAAAIEKVEIVIKESGGEEPDTIEKVSVGAEEGNEQGEEGERGADELSEKVRQTVASLYGLEAEKVAVILK